MRINIFFFCAPSFVSGNTSKTDEKYLAAFEVPVDNFLGYWAINTMENDQIRANFHFVPATKMQVKFKEVIN